MASQPPALPSTVRGLLKIPREVFHQILDDLPVSQVLALSCQNVPYIDECIVGHLHYKKLFRSLDELHSMRDYFRLYVKIATASSISIHKTSVDLAIHPSNSSITYDALMTHLHVLVVKYIEHATPSLPGYLDTLSTFSPIQITEVWNSSTFKLLQQRWNALSDATVKINQMGAQQLLRMHDLLAAHPLVLKIQPDPSQEPRSNTQHIANRLKRYAEQQTKPKWGLGSKRVFKFTKRLTLVPYDRYLNLFLKVLERYPLPDKDMPGITLPPSKLIQIRFRGRPVPVPPESEEEEPEHPKSGGGSQPEGNIPRTKQKFLHTPHLSDEQREGFHHEYTPEAVQKIRKAILGLKYVYITPLPSDEPTPTALSGSPPAVPKGKIVRTKHTPYSVYPENYTAGFAQPCFAPPLDNREACYVFPEKELAWLEAFVWSCAYMKSIDAKYNANMTIKELWEKRASLC